MRLLALQNRPADLEYSSATSVTSCDDGTVAATASSSVVSTDDASVTRKEPACAGTSGKSKRMSFWHMVDLEQNAAKRARVGDNDQDHDVETQIVNELTAFCTEEFSCSPQFSSTASSSDTSNYCNQNADVLAFWRSVKDRFPLLSGVARKYLGVPATSVPSERVFSATSYIISNRRSALKPSSVDKLTFPHANW